MADGVKRQAATIELRHLDKFNAEFGKYFAGRNFVSGNTIRNGASKED